ncbi:MAG: hypothetical protein KC731_43240, partial [Myxococcales bacterium]|nr:hypothetical protein [Myxococcales bacterium]
WHNHKLLTVDAQDGWVTIRCGGGPSGEAAGYGGDDGPAEAALLRQPSAVAFDAAGKLYFVDQLNQRVRVIDEAGVVRAFAGNGEVGAAGDGGLAEAASFDFGSGSNPNPGGGLVVDGDRVLVADTENHRVRAIDVTTGIIETVVGTGEAGYGGDDGPAVAAMLHGPRDLEIGPDGALYLADTDNGVVRRVDRSTGVITTVVGTGELGLAPDDGLAAQETPLRRPFGIAFDGEGALYVVDSANSRVLRVAP